MPQATTTLQTEYGMNSPYAVNLHNAVTGSPSTARATFPNPDCHPERSEGPAVRREPPRRWKRKTARSPRAQSTCTTRSPGSTSTASATFPNHDCHPERSEGSAVCHVARPLPGNDPPSCSARGCHPERSEATAERSRRACPERSRGDPYPASALHKPRKEFSPCSQGPIRGAPPKVTTNVRAVRDFDLAGITNTDGAPF